MNNNPDMSAHNLQPGIEHGGFIPSLEGMRALAVVVVLLFHLDIPGTRGGYLGIELFFVISGYIITRNILFDQRAGRFSLRGFYVRRIRRLLPALLVTVLLTLLFALACVPPAELQSTARSAVFAIFSLANINFWLEAGYFDAEAHYKPLLHTWSLSVEEQFYLLWPALLVLLAARVRLFLCMGLLVLSLAGALVFRNSMPESVFYLLPFKMYELMAGALVAMLALRLTGLLGNGAALVGCCGFVTATIIVTAEHSPAVSTAVVCGLSLLLMLGRESRAAGILLGNRPMQWLGARSYSLYLVHWPIIVLYQYQTDFGLSAYEQASLGVISIIAAAALHELVEKPFRISKQGSIAIQRVAWPALGSTLAATVALAGGLWLLQGLQSRVDPTIQDVVASVEREIALRQDAIRFGECNLHEMHAFSDYDPANCASIDAQRPDILVIGDSLAADIYMMLDQNYPEIHIAQATAGACQPLLDTSALGGSYPACLQLNALRFDELVKRDWDLIVLASNWTPERIAPLGETLAYLRAIDRRTLVIGPRVKFAGPVPLELSRQASLDGFNQHMQARVRHPGALLKDMQEALPEIAIVDIAAMQCAPQCNVLEGRQLLYFDAMHLTTLGARRVGEQFRKSFDLFTLLHAPQYVTMDAAAGAPKASS